MPVLILNTNTNSHTNANTNMNTNTNFDNSSDAHSNNKILLVIVRATLLADCSCLCHSYRALQGNSARWRCASHLFEAAAAAGSGVSGLGFGVCYGLRWESDGLGLIMLE